MELFNIIESGNFNPSLLVGLVLRFIFNIGMATALVCFVYNRNSQNKEFAFTLFSFNMIIFALCTILNNIELSIGSGFGLFAVFTMMRYRSEQLQIKDMTYLLMMVGLGFINSTFQGPVGPLEIVFLNLSMILFLFILEKTIFRQNVIKQKIKYEKLDLLKVGNRKLLRLNLEERIGARIVNVKVESVNYLEGSASLEVKYNRDDPNIEPAIMIRKEQTEKNDETLFVNGL
ncbi:MAG: DUF4956 domain-containing protein [Cytophagales bacterium]|nr:DUF4956 domain-containing protein [Cytophagales bacterium]